MESMAWLTASSADTIFWKSCLIFMVLSSDEGKMMELGFLPAGDTQSKSVGLSMRKKTHNLLYTAISYWASPVKPPELCLLALNCFLLTPLLALQCWLSMVLLLIKKEGLLLKLHLIVMMIGRLWSISLTIAVCKFFSLSVACLNLILGSPIPFAAMTAGGSSTAVTSSQMTIERSGLIYGTCKEW